MFHVRLLAPMLLLGQAHARVMGRLRPASGFIKRATRLWVSLFVRDLNLCPFVHPVINSEDKLRIQVSRDSLTPGEVLQEVVDECGILMGGGPAQTTLIVYPRLNSLNSYLLRVQEIEELLDDLDLSKVIQVASFHPKYRFKGEEEGRVTHWTNRSPFPMIHLLRVEDVTRAIDMYKGAGKKMDLIWQRNQAVMEELGLDRIEQLNREILDGARRRTSGEDTAATTINTERSDPEEGLD
jgi:hypothetical protein